MRKNILILGHNDATQFIDIYNQYTRLFDTKKFEVTVAFLKCKASNAIKERLIAEQVIFLDFPPQKIRNLKIGAIRQLFLLCKKKKFHTIICHRYKPTYIMLWVAQFLPIPLLVFVMHELGTMSSLHRKVLIRSLHRKNMLFAGVSNAVRDDLRKSLWGVAKENIITLYNVIDADLTEPKLLARKVAREALHLPADAFVFGNIARLSPNKDHKSLIQAFSSIKKHCPKAKLVIVGDGPLEHDLKKQAAFHDLTEDIIFTGFLANGFRYMQAFDCFVLSSIQEAFGRVLLEAMIAKLPIIATRVHGIPEVIGEAGLLINPNTPAVLASALKEIYTKPQQEREQCGEKAYQHVLNYFSIPTFREQFWQLSLVKPLKE